ncbi:hypothetical protein [Bradyrhizobium sp. 25ACV]
MAKPEDWLKSSPKQRRDLYQAVHRLEQSREIRWAEFVRAATNQKSISGAFRENFRKGNIGRQHAAKIYKHLQENHPQTVAALDVEAFTNKVFNEFLPRFRRLGLISLYPETVGPAFLSHRRGPEWIEMPFEIADALCFCLRLPFAYDAIVALNGCDTGWFPLRMTKSQSDDVAPSTKQGDLMLAGTQGEQTICTVHPTPQESENRRGSNVFIFIAGDFSLLEEVATEWKPGRAITEGELTRMSEKLSRSIPRTWALTQINATGIGPY